MNILFICDEYPPGPHGGIGTAVQLLARALAAKGHQIVVAGLYDWGYGGAEYEQDEGVHVYRFRRVGNGKWAQNRRALPVRIAYRILRKTGAFQWSIERSLPFYKRFLEGLVEKHRIEIAEATDFMDYAQHLQRAAFFPTLSIPYIVKLHGSITHYNAGTDTPTAPAVFDTEKQLLQGAAGVVSVSRFALQKTEALFGLKLPATIIPNGLSLTDFPTTIPAKNEKQVLFSGTLVALKGIQQLAKAWNAVIAAVPDARLDVFGKGALNRILPLLSLQSRKRVFFHGHVARKTLLQNLQSAAIGVFPSYTETFGLGAAEAMASGCAVIYTRRAAGPELVEDGVEGLLVDPDDVADLSRKMILLLQKRELRATLAQNAFLKTHRLLDINILADLHLRYYNQILREHSRL